MVPANAGVFGLVSVVAPPGTITNAVRPAPVFGCTFEMAKRVPETVLKAFADAVPDLVAAGGFCSGNNLSARAVSPTSDEERIWYNYYEGGQGSTARHDGNNALYFWAGTATNQPIEVWEHKYPVVVDRYGLVPDSGGPGKYRGGLGSVHEIRVLWDHYLSGIGDRHRVPPWGLAGGLPGAPNRWCLRRDGREVELQEAFDLPSPSKFYNVHLRAGDVLVIYTGGGGGHGSPRDRDAAAVEADIREGYVSPEAARALYGYAPCGGRRCAT
jgi:N-methylhydantoinase B/oxoprolinase/acetone carboxylase alpha subunit